MPKRITRRSKNSYRSGFEKTVADQLTKAGVKFEYETEELEYFIKRRGAFCESCGSDEVLESHWYTPDFKIGDVYIEVKGKFTSSARTKMKAVKEAWPFLDIRMLFMRDNWLTKNHNSRYSDWAVSSGFKFAIHKLPVEWIKEFIIKQNGGK